MSQWKDLGLVIIDEEQRFGVKHKERLKEICKGIDAVAMSATPIPRTLHMSLLGLRDMSVIETPPKDRLVHSHGGGAVRAGHDQVRRSSWNWPAAGRSISCTIASIPSGTGPP